MRCGGGLGAAVLMCNRESGEASRLYVDGKGLEKRERIRIKKHIRGDKVSAGLQSEAQKAGVTRLENANKLAVGCEHGKLGERKWSNRACRIGRWCVGTDRPLQCRTHSEANRRLLERDERHEGVSELGGVTALLPIHAL